MTENELLLLGRKLGGGGGDISELERRVTDLENVVGDEDSGLVKNVSDLQDEISKEETVTGTNPVITAAANTRYICGEVSTLSFTPSATGLCEVIFTSGSSVAVLTLPNTVKMPAWFTVETNTTYEISILNGVYGGVCSWPTA